MSYQPIPCVPAASFPPRRRALRRIFRAGATLALAAAVGLAAAPLHAAAARGSALQAWDGGRTVTAVATGDALRVEVGAPGAAAASVAEAALPAGAEAWTAAVLADGWAVAGSRPAGAGAERLFFTVGDAAGVRALPDPAGQRSPIRQDPVLMVDGGRLVGAAWLEGDDVLSLGVRAAAWDGERWSAPERVARPAPGSQLGLAGAVLDDGSWLLVWAAFDGTDHEILWAQRLGGGWLPVGQVSAGNSVPDALPALTATGGGALIAWNRFDGVEYRLRTARFVAGEWVDEAWAAPAGSIFPSFAGGRERPWLLYRDARARGWAVAEVSAAGGSIGTPRVVPEAPADRPAVALGDGEPALVWRPAAAGGRSLRVEMRAGGPAVGGGGQP